MPANTPSITIYHAAHTRSMRVIWACEELGIGYQRVTVDFSENYRSSPEWRKMNPVGKVPVMTDGELKIFESGAMVQYLLDRYGDGRLQPKPGTPEHARYLQWGWFAEATFARPVGEIVNHRRAFSAENQSEPVIREMQARVQLCVDAIGQELDRQEYICGGEFTAADILLGYSLHLQQLMAPCAYTEGLQAYWQRISSRAGYLVACAPDAN
jgi:glutathione S-transferase